MMLKEFNFPNGVDSEDPAEKKKKNGQGVMCAMMAFNAIVTANPDDAELKTGAAARSRRRRRHLYTYCKLHNAAGSSYLLWRYTLSYTVSWGRLLPCTTQAI